MRNVQTFVSRKKSLPGWLLATCFLLLNSSIAAKEIRLFDNNKAQVLDYRNLIETLNPGDLLFFDNDRFVFEYEHRLGHGSTTEVIQVRAKPPTLNLNHSIALRIPFDRGQLNYYEFGHETPFREYIDSYRSGAKKLKKLKIRIPKIHLEFKDQFIAVELTNPAFDLADFLQNKTRQSSVDLKKAETALYDFARSTAQLTHIGDFRGDQLVYDKEQEEWILLDFSHEHKRLFFLTSSKKRRKHVFSSSTRYLKNLNNAEKLRAKKILQNIQDIIIAERLPSRSSHKSCLSKLASALTLPQHPGFTY